MSWYRWSGDDLELALRVQPRAPKDAFLGPRGDHYRVAIKAPPVEGKANAALRRFLAEAFGVAPARVTLIGGEQARYKRVRIEDPRIVPIALEPPTPGT
ncbi:MAG: YggU family protein [Sphingobacteriia bacterium]|nr:YggU family protein [Sphingobacteriia bacterium]NCC40149.1 YggU family protein [Gammaproteobacteria bacterium]